MAKMVITVNAGILNIVYNTQPGRFQEYSRNISTGQNIALLKNAQCVETSILCKGEQFYTHDMVDTVEGVAIASNQSLFDELEKLL